MNKIIFKEEIIILGLLYNYEVNASRMLPQFTIKDFVEKVNINLDEMDVKINRVDKLDSEIIDYTIIKKADESKYYMLKNVIDTETARHELIRKIPFAIIKASQMPNALEVLGIQMVDGKMQKLEKKELDLEEIIERALDNPYLFYKKIASVLIPEEKEFLKKQIGMKCCLNCTNPSCQVTANEKTMDTCCVAWENQELLGRQLLLKKNWNKNKIK